MHKIKIYLWWVLLSFLLASSSAWAEVRIDGYFIANDQSCPAYQSIRKKTNPGNVHLITDRAYSILSKNKFDATHYRLRINDATPTERWVSKECGIILTQCDKSATGTQDSDDGNSHPSNPSSPSPTNQSSNNYLLALSWQPAFCQTHQSKLECQTQTESRYDATHLTLHGLWPQPRSNIYCDVPNAQKKLDKRGAWAQLPHLGLSDELMSELIEIMPGVSSHLQRHEWIKHGTCYSETANEYYRESIQLALDVNNSSVRDLFANNIGERLTSNEIKARFDNAFGEGTGKNVMVKCNSGMINELWINLKGDIEEDADIADLLSAAPNAGASCQSGLVDDVGF